MAIPKAGLDIELQGEAEYRKAIQAINADTKVLTSEMQKLKAEYEGNETSTEALRAKSENLERQLLQQKDKIELLRGAVKNAASEYGEADKRTSSWKIQLNNAEAAEIKLKKELDATNEALKNQEVDVKENGEELDSLSKTVGQIASDLGIHLPDSVEKALAAFDSFSSGTIVSMGAVALAIGAVFEAVKSLHELTIQAAEDADELLTRAAKTGIDVELLQQLDYAQRFLDFDRIEESLSRLAVTMGKARDGAQQQADAFAALNVSITNEDGTLRSAWETFLDVIDALGDIENKTEADVIANELFGKSYTELNPLIAAGSDELQRYTEAARENGYVLSEEQVSALGAVDDAVQENEARWESLRKKIALEWAPASIEAMDLFGEAAIKAGDALIDSGLIKNFRELIESTMKLGDSTLDLFDEKFPSFLNPIQLLNDALDGLTLAIDFVIWEINAIGSALDWVISKAQEAYAWIQNVLNNAGAAMADYDYDWGVGGSADYGYNAAGDSSWRGGMTWVGEGGAELVSLPRGSRIYDAQESQMIAQGSATDTSRLEADTGRIERLLEMIYAEFSSLRVKERMA